MGCTFVWYDVIPTGSAIINTIIPHSGYIQYPYPLRIQTSTTIVITMLSGNSYVYMFTIIVSIANSIVIVCTCRSTQRGIMAVQTTIDVIRLLVELCVVVQVASVCEGKPLVTLTLDFQFMLMVHTQCRYLSHGQLHTSLCHEIQLFI